MSLPFKSLDAATATGPGASKDLEGSYGRHTMVVTIEGDPTCSLSLEGSHDSDTWITLATANNLSSVTQTVLDVPEGHLVRFVRANLTSLTGGTSPTVTATIATETNEED